MAGFGVHVHATGRKYYIVQSWEPAGLKRITMGRVGGKPIDKLRHEAALVIDRIKRGEGGQAHGRDLLRAHTRRRRRLLDPKFTQGCAHKRRQRP